LRSTQSQQKFFLSQHWKNSGCHVAPFDWATSHPVIRPYGTVNTHSVHSQLPHHLPCQHSYCLVTLPRQHLYNPVTLPRQHLYNPVTLLCQRLYCLLSSIIGLCHVWTAMCHPYTATCKFCTGPTQPKNAKTE
jgi:hypothetical protein